MRTLKPEILIVGAGISGVPIAIALKKRGYDVLLVERLTAPKKIFKGEYLQPAAVKFLEPLALDDLLHTGEWIRELRFRDVDGAGNVVSDLLVKYPSGHAARSTSHDGLLEALFQRAKEELGDKFWLGIDLVPLRKTMAGVTESGETEIFDSKQFCRHPQLLAKKAGQEDILLEPSWVIGCDGRGSSVRKWMGGKNLPRKESVTWGSQAEWIVGLELESTAQIPQRYEVFRSFGDGTTCLFSLGGGKQRLYFSQPLSEKDSENPLRTAVKQIRKVGEGMETEGFQPLPEDVGAVRAYSAGTGWYGHPAKGRCLLVGDALAVTTPFGGQGMTSACEHAKALIENFPWRSQNPLILRSARSAYAKSARATYNRICLLNFGLYHLFFDRSALMKLPTRHIIETWKQNPELGERVMRLFGGLDTDRPAAPEILKLWGVLPGSSLQNSWLEHAKRQNERLQKLLPVAIVKAPLRTSWRLVGGLTAAFR